jgi:uncharacterized BrkB/YihY/UPF0761 family membrane protein
MARERRERLEALLASGQASVERARARSLVVDTVVGVVRRERPVAVGILAAALAFRLFALLIPLAYVLVAGFGFAGTRASRPGGEDRLSELVVDSVAAASQSSERARWLALIFGGLATLLAAASVVEVLRWIQVLAWGVRPARARRNPWPGLGLVGGVAVLGLTSALTEQARASTLYGSLGVALTLLVSLFLLSRLAVAAEELNAALWERRHPDGQPHGRAAA